MEKSLEERVSDLESIYTDVPELMNLRFERIRGELSEINGRLNILDRQVGALTRDLRDFRGGVTRLLVEHEKRLNVIDGRLNTIDGRLDAIDGRLDAIDGRLDAIDGRLNTIDARLDVLSGQMTALGVKLDTVLGRLGA